MCTQVCAYWLVTQPIRLWFWTWNLWAGTLKVDVTSFPLRLESGTHLGMCCVLTDGSWKLEPSKRWQCEANRKVTLPHTKMATAASSRGRKWDTSIYLNKAWEGDKKRAGERDQAQMYKHDRKRQNKEEREERKRQKVRLGKWKVGGGGSKADEVKKKQKRNILNSQ